MRRSDRTLLQQLHGERSQRPVRLRPNPACLLQQPATSFSAAHEQTTVHRPAADSTCNRAACSERRQLSGEREQRRGRRRELQCSAHATWVRAERHRLPKVSGISANHATFSEWPSQHNYAVSATNTSRLVCSRGQLTTATRRRRLLTRVRVLQWRKATSLPARTRFPSSSTRILSLTQRRTRSRYFRGRRAKWIRCSRSATTTLRSATATSFTKLSSDSCSRPASARIRHRCKLVHMYSTCILLRHHACVSCFQIDFSSLGIEFKFDVGSLEKTREQKLQVCTLLHM